MKLSIVTNAFNQGRFLERCIDSVLSQDYPEIEYIVVDPGSTDNTPQILDRYEGRLTRISERDSGPSDGLNKAFSIASGDVFAYLNADDVYLPGALRRAAHALTSRPQAGAIFGNAYLADMRGRIYKRARSTEFSKRRFIYGNFLVLQQSTFYRRSAFEKAGGFNPVNNTSWDLELILDIVKLGYPVKAIDEFWSVFSIHSESITGSQRLAAHSKINHKRIFKELTGSEESELHSKLRRYGGKLPKVETPKAIARLLLDRVIPLPQFPSLELK